MCYGFLRSSVPHAQLVAAAVRLVADLQLCSWDFAISPSGFSLEREAGAVPHLRLVMQSERRVVITAFIAVID